LRRKPQSTHYHLPSSKPHPFPRDHHSLLNIRILVYFSGIVKTANRFYQRSDARCSRVGTGAVGMRCGGAVLHSHSVHVLLEEERPTSGRPRGSHPLILTPPPLQRHTSATARFVVFVRAGMGWC